MYIILLVTLLSVVFNGGKYVVESSLKILTQIVPQESKVYQQGEKVEVRGLLQHLHISHGEARQNNTRLRIIYPSWLSWVSGSDTCKTNSTSGSSEDCQVASLEERETTKYLTFSD